MRKHFFAVTLLFIFILAGLNLYAWVPSNGGFGEIAKKIAKGNNEITYYLNTPGRAYLVDPQKVFDKWFDNVLRYRNTYPGFNEVFELILPLLEKKPVLKEVKERKAENIDLLIINNFYASDLDLPAKRGGYHREYIITGFGNFEAIRITYIARDEEEMQYFLHEVGHLLGLGEGYDVTKYGEVDHSSDMTKGSGRTKKSIMHNKVKKLTCDDADALAAILFMLKGREDYTFRSFCNDGSGYIDGKYVNYDEMRDIALVKKGLEVSKNLPGYKALQKKFEEQQ